VLALAMGLREGGLVSLVFFKYFTPPHFYMLLYILIGVRHNILSLQARKVLFFTLLRVPLLIVMYVSIRALHCLILATPYDSYFV